MRLPGYCQFCHKIKQVRVNVPVVPGGVVVGTCSSCEDKEAHRGR